MSLLDTPSLASIMAGQAAQNLGEQISDRYELEPATSLRVAADCPGAVLNGGAGATVDHSFHIPGDK